SRRRHTRLQGDWSSDVCSSDLLPEAERQFKTSIELTPNWVQAHRGYSICLRAMGRADEAVAADKEARESDPRSAERATSLGWTRSEERRVGKECRARRSGER